MANEHTPLLGFENVRHRPTFKWLAAVFAVAFLVASVMLVRIGVENTNLKQQIMQKAEVATTAVLSPESDFVRRRGRMSAANRAKRAYVMDELTQGFFPEGYVPSWETYSSEDLPKDWDWRNVSGVNYLTPNKQQHLPVYCGGCWAFASVQSLNDRIHIARNASFPPVGLAHQVLLNCQDCGDCEEGGDGACVYGYAHKYGMPDETCQPYQARTGVECIEGKKKGTKHCNAECLCKNAEADRKTMYAITEYRKWYVGAHGRLPTMNIHAMKSEIYAHGPIICGIACTDNFEYNYAGGIFAEKTNWTIDDFDHEVAVSGWGVDENTGEEYWLVRNTWGMFWGEQGWFKLKMGVDNMGVEAQCHYAIIDLDQSAELPPIPLSKYYTPPPTPTPKHKKGKNSS